MYVTSSAHDYIDIANPGSAHLSMIHMEPSYESCWSPYWCSYVDNSVIVEVYTSFADTDLLPHDWQVVALGKEEPVSVVSMDGLSSESISFKSKSMTMV